MPWKKFQFRDQTVFVRVLPTGKPIVRRGRAEMRYRLGATKSYRTTPDNLTEIDGEEILEDADFGGQQTTAATSLRETPKVAATDATIVIHTDGACSGNPGPAGIGVHLVRPSEIVEISEFIGEGTNNVAELTAILRALETLTEAEEKAHIHLFTDSGWSLGVLVGGWKAKTNLTLIKKVQEQIERFSDLELLKVRGHAGQDGNEEADHLATKAVRREESSTKVRPR
ncbi:MAG: reverse transcriptase-like protein [Myxococcales bacterium]|nr:reverse transcriptase-like protein [Myxococcales bacterium]